MSAVSFLHAILVLPQKAEAVVDPKENHMLDKHACAALRKSTSVMTAMARICIIHVLEPSQTEIGLAVYSLTAMFSLIEGLGNRPRISVMPAWFNER